MPEPTSQSQSELKKAQAQINGILFDKAGKPANSNNIVLVSNPDLNCDAEDTIDGWSHRDYFEVKWDGRPHRVIPGQTRRMPLWLAVHFAKHLADHILMKQSDTLLNNPVRRPLVLAQILLSTEEYFDEEPMKSEGEKVEEEVNAMNPPNPLAAALGMGGKSQELPETNVGVAPHPTIGTLTPEPKSEAEVIKEAEKQTGELAPETEVVVNKKSFKRLEIMRELTRMQVPFRVTETNDSLLVKMKAF